MKRHILFYLFVLFSNSILAVDYHVGPSQTLANISDVPWESLQAGDRVYIHWRSTPYKEKWVINAQGTAADPIEVIGVSGTSGEKPIVDGDGAVTPTNLDYWNEVRGIIKIGGSSVPSDALPSYISIENLEIRSCRPAYQFTNDNGQTEQYVDNAAPIYIEKGEHIIIRDCELYDSGNGIFIGASGGETQDILISGNYIHDNGIVGSFYEHNTYTEAWGITYEYNRFGPLRAGALGNNLKDRSAGLVVRYNWIESGNRQLDLVDSGSSTLIGDASYNSTHVYGNILIEPDGAGNSQILHYGGDSGNTANYRKGNLYFYNNTVISTRNGNTTLARLSSPDETMEAFNNVVYITNGGSSLAMVDNDGTLNISNCWLNTGWVDSHGGSIAGSVNDMGSNINGTDPMFLDFASQDFVPAMSSPLIDAGSIIPANLLPEHDVAQEYVKHTSNVNRQVVSNLDIGAFEYLGNASLEEMNESFVVYPNPTSSHVHVLSINNSIIDQIELVDLGGNILLKTTESELNLSRFPSGMYFIRMASNKLFQTMSILKR